VAQQVIFIDGLDNSTKFLFAKYLSVILDLPIISVYANLTQREVDLAYFDNNYVRDLIELTQKQNLSYLIPNFCLSRAVFALFLRKVFDFNLAIEANKIFVTQFNAKLLYFDISFDGLKNNIVSRSNLDFNLAELFEIKDLYELCLAKISLPFKRIEVGHAINVVDVCNFIRGGGNER